MPAIVFIICCRGNWLLVDSFRVRNAGLDYKFTFCRTHACKCAHAHEHVVYMAAYFDVALVKVDNAFNVATAMYFILW